MEIQEYVNQIRRNVLMRLSPDDANARRAEAIEIDSSYFHSESMPFEEPVFDEIDENEPNQDIF